MNIRVASVAGPICQVGLVQEDFIAASKRLGCTVAQLRAVDEVESGGGWYENVRKDILNIDGPGGFIDGQNLPKILFEAHIFDRETQGRFRSDHPKISSKNWDRALYAGGQNEWLRLHQAMLLDRKAALRSASVGRYQIMGFNHVLAGYSDVKSFWQKLKISEAYHLEAFIMFIENSRMGAALRRISNVHADCEPFARLYNGTGYKKNNYHIKIARAHSKWLR